MKIYIVCVLDKGKIISIQRLFFMKKNAEAWFKYARLIHNELSQAEMVIIEEEIYDVKDLFPEG